MELTQETRDALMNASIVMSVIDTDDFRAMSSALECAAKTGSDSAIRLVVESGPNMVRRLMAEASIDAWIPDGWSGSAGEMDAACALAAGRERQASSLREAVAAVSAPALVGA